MKFCKKKGCRSRKASVMHSVMKHHWGTGSETYALIPSWLTNVFPALRLRTVAKAAGLAIQEVLLRWGEFFQDWPKTRCSLLPAGKSQVYSLDLMQNLGDVFTTAPTALSWCGRKTAQDVMLPQDLVSAPQAEIERHTRENLSHNSICKSRTDKQLNCHCCLCKMKRYMS